VRASGLVIADGSLTVLPGTDKTEEGKRRSGASSRPQHQGLRGAARGTGCGRALYDAFAAAAAAQGADRLKAITSVANTGSVAFHRRLGFEVRQVDDYDGPGTPMMVMTRPLPFPG
jgi:GNAT superfamily N-acetyltransferase